MRKVMFCPFIDEQPINGQAIKLLLQSIFVKNAILHIYAYKYACVCVWLEGELPELQKIITAATGQHFNNHIQCSGVLMFTHLPLHRCYFTLVLIWP